MKSRERMKRYRNPHLYCLGCEYTKRKEMQINGKPDQMFFCTHPEYTGNNELLKPLLEDGRLIGWKDIKPDWCPKKLGNKVVQLGEDVARASGWLP